MIYSSLPTDWRDLQDKVAEVFREIGFETEVEKPLKIVRGSKNIDVYAEDQTQSPNLIYLCECKYWDSPVPQEKVQAFHTVVAGSGANYGLMISKRGFQSGSFSASEYTNIKLLDWLQFQELFEDRWIRDYMTPQIWEKHGALTSYTNFAMPLLLSMLWDFDEQMDAGNIQDTRSHTYRSAMWNAERHGISDEEGQRQYAQLYYDCLGITILTDFLSVGYRLRLPLQKATIAEVFPSLTFAQSIPILPPDLIEITALHDFLDIIIDYCGQAIQQFDELIQDRGE